MKKTIFFLALFFIGCKLLAPANSPAALGSTQNLSNEVDSFYTAMSNAADKTYPTATVGYTQINTDIQSLEGIDSVRKNSSALMVIVKDMANRFAEYQSEHQAFGVLNNAQILAYKEGMDAIFQILITTENNYK